MALDGLVVHALVHELQTCVGGRINKIYQPSEQDVVLHIRAGGANRKLLLSASPTYPRVHFTEQSFANPTEAPMFCMLLRKHCESSVIESVEQVDAERIIHLDIRGRDELGDVTVKRIVVELMGRHSNIVLLDPQTNAVLDSIRHVTPAISSYRVVLPGSAYVAPPQQHKRDPLHTPVSEVAAYLNEHVPADDPAQALVDGFTGISPLTAKAVVSAAGDPAAPERIAEAFAAATARVRRHDYEISIVTDRRKGKSHFSVIPLPHLDGDLQKFTSISECLEEYYGDKAERDVTKQRATDLLRFVHNEIGKNEKKLIKLQETLDESQNAEQYRIMGDLLTASLHTIRKGDAEARVVDYYEEEQPERTIPLDPLLTPSENAQRLFRKYTKVKNSALHVQEQMANTIAENHYFRGLLQQLESASLADIGEIREELAEQGYVKQRKSAKRGKKKTDKPALTCFTSSEGVSVYVGKNNTQNDYLTLKFAHSSDTWLHTKDMPGSHVLIRGQSFGAPTLQEAAVLAAWFSQGKQSSGVPVDYTLVRHVRKPNGAKPGFVIYDHQRTLYVTPDENIVRSLTVHRS